MSSSPGLDVLQREFLGAFLSGRKEFFLTGGAALIGFHGLARKTEDLDLFTLEDFPLEVAGKELERTAGAIGATCRVLRTSTDFRRYLVERGTEATTVDLVRERVVQAVPEKPEIDGVRVDPLEDILANKICTLISRSEVRDLWDVYQISRRGLSLDAALETAAMKDGGATVEALVWILSELFWPALGQLAERERLSDWENVEDFFKRLQKDLAIRLLPGGG